MRKQNGREARDRHEAASIAETLTADSANAGLSRYGLALQAALQGYLTALITTGQIVSEMAADHEHGGDHAGAALLREAVKQIATVPDDRP